MFLLIMLIYNMMNSYLPVGKSGIDFAQQLANEYELPDEPKSVQIGVRFEAPQKHFQKSN
jgi:uncharacterized FAD-dependent dehydrogenase